MNPSSLILLALKGTCALNCLAALHLAGPQPVTQRVIMDLTGFDDAAVRKGLHTLLVLGLVTSAGEERRTAWQLAPAAYDLPLPLAPVLASPENVDSESLLKEEEKEKEKEIAIFNLLDSSILLPSPQPPATDPAPHTIPPPNQKALRAQLYAAFEAANVFLQCRRPLADALLRDDGPGWLRQSLGWICYSQRRLPHVKRGAVVFISLRDRLPCDPAYFPPAELPFDAALAWALRGGETEPDDAHDTHDTEDADVTEDTDDTHDTGITVGAEFSPAAESSPAAQLWQAALERLARELPPVVVESQLRPARLLALEAERCRLAAASPQSRDWLQARLGPLLARVLSQLAGRPLSVEIVYP